MPVTAKRSGVKKSNMCYFAENNTMYGSMENDTVLSQTTFTIHYNPFFGEMLTCKKSD